MATYKMIIEESFIPTLVELAQPRRTTDMNKMEDAIAYAAWRVENMNLVLKSHLERAFVHGHDLDAISINRSIVQLRRYTDELIALAEEAVFNAIHEEDN